MGLLGSFLAAGGFCHSAAPVCLGTSMFWDSVMTWIMSIKMPIHSRWLNRGKLVLPNEVKSDLFCCISLMRGSSTWQSDAVRTLPFS